MIKISGRRYKLQWSGNGDRVGGVGVMVKEVCEVVDLRLCDRGCSDVYLLACSAKWMELR